MTRRTPRGRPGITLTEILISILILGVGMVSLATLFPIGLLRLRDAQRNNRSVLLTRFAIGEVNGRDLFNRSWFLSLYGSLASPYDPWISDGPAGNGNVQVSAGAYQLEASQPGLPVAYDPLFYAQNGLSPATNFARFGAANASDPLRADSGGSSLAASAAGLQRISGFTVLSDPSIFVSPDDYVFQPENGATVGGSSNLLTGASPLIPALDAGNQTVHDFAYSWAFTGYRAEAGEFSRYVGSIVIFNNRSFGFVNGAPTGERVVEGIFGYGGNRRLVMLRWHAGQPDPGVVVGGWIADVTYEQSAANNTTKTTNNPPPGPMQRCNWYRVAKRGAATPDPNNSAFMQMQVTVATPVTTMTVFTGSNPPTPIFTNAALIMPSVVNVFPWSFFTRN